MRYKDIHNELLEWKEENIISQEQYETLKKRYEPLKQTIPRFHKKLSPQKVLIFFSLIIVVLGTLSLLGQKFATINNFVVFGALIFMVIGALYFGDYLADRNLVVIRFIGKAIMIMGCLLTTFIVFYIDVKIFNTFGIKILGNDWSLFMLVSALILIMVAYKTREKTILAYSIIFLFVWFISEGKIHAGGYAQDWLGMTLPSRMFLFSLIFVIIGYMHEYKTKISSKFKLNEKFNMFFNTYYVLGLLFMFVPVFAASMGKWLVNPILSLRFEALFFLILSFAISIYTTYTGLIKNNSLFINLGLIFFAVQVFGKLYQMFGAQLNNPIFYVIFTVIAILAAIVIEYTLTNKKELRKELLKENKG